MPKMTRREKLPPAPKRFTDFSRKHPKVAKAYDDLGEAVRGAGPLTEREIALVKLALSIGARSEGGAHAHTRKGLGAGVEADALRHVAILAVPTLGFPHMMAALGWVDETVEAYLKR
jgi:alkylhydroperoxidase/carboxymuconolactone decarboxylase family protein YurZ